MKHLYLVLVLTLLTFFHNHGTSAKSTEISSSINPAYCSPSEVISYTPGKDLAGNEIAANRKLPNLALYAEDDSGDNYVSLGIGGKIVLKYDLPIRNLPGKDLTILETSPEGKNCSVYKPSIAVYASQDNLTWILLEHGCQDVQVDLGGMAWAQYFMLIDISNTNDFNDPSFDGYHLDGIKALQCPNYSPLTDKIEPFVECVTDNGDGTFTATFAYDNKNPHFAEVAIGNDNKITADDANASFTNLPSIFEVGKFHKALQVTFSSGSVSWSIKGPDDQTLTATATASATKCVSAVLRGGADICSGGSTSLFVDLEGVAPWTIKYKGGNGQTKTVIAHSSPHEIKVSTPDTYLLESVVDGAGDYANVFGIARVFSKPTPTATLTGDGKTCGDNLLLKVDINCNCIPFTITYWDGLKDTTVVTAVTPYYILGKVGRTYTLKSISNQFCVGVASGSVTVEKVVPTATLKTGIETCVSSDSFSPIGVELTGTAPWTVSYTVGSVAKDTTVSQNYFEIKGLPGFTYSLTSVKDARCTVAASGSISIYPKPTALLSGSNSVCSESEVSNLTIKFTGTAPFTYTYTNGVTDVVATTTEMSVAIPVTGTGTFNLVSVKDAHCDGSVSGKAEITLNTATADFSLNAAYCHGDYISLDPIFNGSTAESFEFTTSGKGTISNAQSGIIYIPAADEKGVISFTLTGVWSCGAAITPVSKSTEIKEKLNAVISYSPSEVLIGEPIIFTLDSENPLLQTWTINNSDVSTEQSFEYTFSEGGEKQVIVFFEKDGCDDSDTVLINVKPKNPNIYVPNIFSISSQNLENKVVKVYGHGVADEGFKFKIFNKWGNLLYEVSDFTSANTKGWNGQLNSSGELQPVGVYTYHLEGKFLNGEKFKKTGTVTLVK